MKRSAERLVGQMVERGFLLVVLGERVPVIKATSGPGAWTCPRCCGSTVETLSAKTSGEAGIVKLPCAYCQTGRGVAWRWDCG